MLGKRIAFLLFSLLFVCAAHAQTIKSGHVLGNGTATERSATDTQLMGVMQQPGAGLGAGVANMLGQPSTGTGGPVGANNPTINNPTIVGGSSSSPSIAVTSTAPYTVLAPATPSGNTIAVNVPWMIPGWIVADTTTPSAIPAGTFVTAINFNQVVLNNNVSGVLFNDTLSFTPPTGVLQPCEKITGGIAGVLSGFYFDESCITGVGGWHLQYNGTIRGWILGTPFGNAMAFSQGDDGAGYLPAGGGTAVEFPQGFTITNPNFFAVPLQAERLVDGGVNFPDGLINKAQASASWATSATTISTSFGCGAGFGLGIAAGETLLDLSLATGTSTASIIGVVASCNAGTGVVTLTGPAAQGSATTTDTLVGIVRATYNWGGGGLGLPSQAIPLDTCTNINPDQGNTITDLTLMGLNATNNILGVVNQTVCYNQVILTANALRGSAGGTDDLLFALPATTPFTTSQNYATVGGCDALASPEVLLDTTLSGNPLIGAVSSCNSNVLALNTNAAINSAGSTDPLIFGNQATGSWPINAGTISVTSCISGTPSLAWLIDLTIGPTAAISVFQGCASPTSIFLGAPASQASVGSSDRLVWSRQAYQTFASGSPAIGVNASASCAGVTAGEVIYDMNVGGGTLVGTVQSCAFYAAVGFGGLVTLTAPSAITVTSGDYLVFGTPATASFTTAQNTVPVASCANFYGPAFFDAASSFQYVGYAAGCGGKVNLTANAAASSAGATDNLVPATPATASWALGDTTISLASCVGFANPQYLVDMTLPTPAVFGQISTCSGGVLTLVAGATHASVGAADKLAPASRSFITQGEVPAGGNFAWSNAVRNLPVPNCAGASPADAVLDLNLSGLPLIGRIGVCSPTLLVTAPPLTASSDIEGFSSVGTLDYLLFTSRRTGDYRINQGIAPGGFALWAATNAGTVENPAAPIAVDAAGTTWAMGNFKQLAPVAIAALPTCAAANAITAGTMSAVKAGTYAVVSNGVASPTYNGAVSTTGAATDPVFCNGSGWVYH